MCSQAPSKLPSGTFPEPIAGICSEVQQLKHKLVPIWDADISIQLSVNVSGTSRRRQAKYLGTCMHIRDLDEALCSWPGPAPTVVAAIWGVQQQMNGSLSSPPSSFCNSAFLIK